MDRDQDSLQEILQEIGAWMQVNGQAIYGSRPWKIDREGNTQEPEGPFTDQKEIPYTREDIRFRARGDSIYAFLIAFPNDGQVMIRSLAVPGSQDLIEKGAKGMFFGKIWSVGILGSKEALEWKQDREGLHVCAKTVKGDLPVVIRVRG